MTTPQVVVQKSFVFSSRDLALKVLLSFWDIQDIRDDARTGFAMVTEPGKFGCLVSINDATAEKVAAFESFLKRSFAKQYSVQCA